MIEVLFNTSSLSDVGCTMRVVSGPDVRRLLPHMTVTDGAFGPEMMILSIIGGGKIVQVPLNYHGRPETGHPGTTENLSDAVKIGLQMIHLITKSRLNKRRIEARLKEDDVRR